jgi:hypothetical protein
MNGKYRRLSALGRRARVWPKTESRQPTAYFEAAASCRTVLMNVSVARVRVRSRR